MVRDVVEDPVAISFDPRLVMSAGLRSTGGPRTVSMPLLLPSVVSLDFVNPMRRSMVA